MCRMLCQPQTHVETGNPGDILNPLTEHGGDSLIGKKAALQTESFVVCEHSNRDQLS